MTTAESIVNQLHEGLLSPIEALMWLSRCTTVAKHDPVYLVILQIITILDQDERREMSNVYGISQDQPSAS